MCIRDRATNDKEQVKPMLKKVQANPEGLNQPQTWLADTGYCSEKNVAACVDAKIEPMIAVKRDDHHPHWRERFSEPEALVDGATPVEAMKHRLKTRAGRAAYALRKQTVEPVFGIIKSIMGFRQFLLRGLANVTNEWTLVCLAVSYTHLMQPEQTLPELIAAADDAPYRAKSGRRNRVML